ncbi:hypothetical protein ACHAWC_010519 [Mediolabrus comicus]
MPQEIDQQHDLVTLPKETFDELVSSIDRMEEFYKAQNSTAKKELKAANEKIDALNKALHGEKSMNKTLIGNIAGHTLEKEKLQSEIENLTSIKAKHEADLAKANADIATASNTIEELKDGIDEIIGQIEREDKLQSEIITLTELKADNEAALAKAAADIATAGNTIEELKDQITGHIEREDKLQSEISDLTAVNAKHERALADAADIITSHVEREAKLQSEIVTLTDLKADNEAALAKAAADISTADKTIEELKDEITGHIEREDKLKSEIITLTESKSNHESALAKAADEAAALNTKVEELKSEITSQYNGHEEEKANMQSEIEELSAIRAETIAALATAAESFEKEIEENKSSISSLLDKLDTATAAEEELTTKLGEAKAANIALLDDIAGLEAGINELGKSVRHLKEEKFVTGELISIQSKEIEELKMAVETARELATKSQNAEKELKSMLDEELKASEALKEEMTKLQSIAQKCEDLKADIDFLTESNAALTEELKESESLKEEMARLQTFIQTPVRATPPKKTRNNIIVTASPPDKAAGEAPPSPTSPNGVEFVPQPLTPPKLTKKQANVSSHDTMEKTSLPGENLRFHQEAEGINSQGNELMHKEKFSEALEQFTTALKLSPDGPNSHIYFSNRAAAYSHLGQYADAAEDCLKSIELNNTYEEAYSRYSMCLFYLGDVKGSVAAQKKSFDLARNAYCSDLNTITEEGSC